ncbi:MAG: viroplasmin family protein [Lachnospiraceae bacterium]|jgi:viroplasmin and RNaseH domain-containing protein
MAYKFYAVHKGKTPGVYTDWPSCRSQVAGYKNPVYKGFDNFMDAVKFVKEGPGPGRSGRTEESRARGVSGSTQGSFVLEKPYAFTDGSYNSKTKVYGYGGFLVHGDKREVLAGSGSDPEFASMRNVAGEILGAEAAVRKALELGLDRLTICYDYMGVEMWAVGKWKRNLAATRRYHEVMQQAMKQMDIRFVKIKSHTGVEGNEEADRLAKKSAGLL